MERKGKKNQSNGRLHVESEEAVLVRRATKREAGRHTDANGDE